jgi:hypothetical protein
MERIVVWVPAAFQLAPCSFKRSRIFFASAGAAMPRSGPSSSASCLFNPNDRSCLVCFCSRFFAKGNAMQGEMVMEATAVSA